MANTIVIPYAQPTSPELRPDTSDKTTSKPSFYLRKAQMEVLENICLGIERANGSAIGKVNLSMLGKAMAEIVIDMAFGVNPINPRETPQDALLRRIQDEVKSKRG